MGWGKGWGMRSLARWCEWAAVTVGRTAFKLADRRILCHGLGADTCRYNAAGFVHVLGKPFDNAKLVAALASCQCASGL